MHIDASVLHVKECRDCCRDCCNLLGKEQIGKSLRGPCLLHLDGQKQKAYEFSLGMSL